MQKSASVKKKEEKNTIFFPRRGSIRWTIECLHKLENCYSRANRLILRQIASETFPPKISNKVPPSTHPHPLVPRSRGAIWLTEFPRRLWKLPEPGSKGWKSGVLPAAGLTRKRLHNEPERGKQWYKRLVESPMDRRGIERKQTGKKWGGGEACDGKGRGG